jgi:dTMP kinase
VVVRVRGRLVAVEGPKGAGKTTLCRHLARRRDPALLVTKEPTPAFDLSQEQRLSGRALAAAIAADREEHVRAVISPALADGVSVVCDRYLLSSLVFHTADGVSADEVRTLNRVAPPPDVNALVTAPPEVLVRRRAARGTRTRLQAVDPAGELARYREEAEAMRSEGARPAEIDGTADPETSVEHLLALLRWSP